MRRRTLSQYANERLQCRMADLGITFSMSHTGNVRDNNAATESLFSSIKTLRTTRKVYRKRGDARANAFANIVRFRNRRRRD